MGVPDDESDYGKYMLKPEHIICENPLDEESLEKLKKENIKSSYKLDNSDIERLNSYPYTLYGNYFGDEKEIHKTFIYTSIILSAYEKGKILPINLVNLTYDEITRKNGEYAYYAGALQSLQYEDIYVWGEVCDVLNAHELWEPEGAVILRYPYPENSYDLSNPEYQVSIVRTTIKYLSKDGKIYKCDIESVTDYDSQLGALMYKILSDPIEIN